MTRMVITFSLRSSLAYIFYLCVMWFIFKSCYFHFIHLNLGSPLCYRPNLVFITPNCYLKGSEFDPLILQPFCHFTYVTAHSPTIFVALPTSQLILQPFRCFTYVTAHSPTLLSLLRHWVFTYVTWRAAHEAYISLLYISHVFYLTS